MNLNLEANYPRDRDGNPSTFASEVDNHIASMDAAGYPVTTEHVLVPEGEEFPGSYQIWLKICHDRGPGSPRTGWIYVDPDGVIHHRMFPGGKVELPTPTKES